MSSGNSASRTPLGLRNEITMPPNTPVTPRERLFHSQPLQQQATQASSSLSYSSSKLAANTDGGSTLGIVSTLKEEISRLQGSL